MEPDPDPNPRPPELRFLKWLVILLTGVMVAGISIIVILLVLRLGPTAPLALPANLDMPEGMRAGAVTLARDWVAVVDEAEQEILIFDRATGALRQRMPIE